MKTRSRQAVAYRTYRLENESTKYNHTVSKNFSKILKHVNSPMKSHTCDPFDPISMIGFLCIFKLVCDTYGIHEDATIWLISFVMSKSAAAALNTRPASKHKAQTRIPSAGKTTMNTIYPQVVNNLLRPYAMKENIAGAEEEMTMFIQTLNKRPSLYTDEPVTKSTLLWRRLREKRFQQHIHQRTP